jgi:hypothetical protein
MDARFSPRTAAVLVGAGWFPGRSVPDLVHYWRAQLVDKGQFMMSRSAEAALTEFGGLRIAQQGVGVDFALDSFVIDPTLAAGAEDDFRHYAKLVGKNNLFPLGEASEQASLAIADTGEVYLIFEGILLLGNSMDTALISLAEGRNVSGAKWMNP